MKYRKKPAVVEAFQWTGGEDQTEDPVWIVDAIRAEKICFAGGCLYLETRDGTMRVNPGDWIIRGVAGEIYSCKPDIFAASYEPADTMGRLHHGPIAKAKGESE